MLSRCRNPNASGYYKYGARGTTVCERWDRYENFLADMGEQPTGLTLDRINPRGNYEPGNCRWLDMQGQQNNRTNNHRLEWRGENLTIMEWSRRTGLNRKTIERRIQRGWSIELTLTLIPS
jgi:Fic family protein